MPQPLFLPAAMTISQTDPEFMHLTGTGAYQEYGDPTELYKESLVTAAGTLSNLRATAISTLGPGSATFAIRVNGVTSGVTVTISDGTPTATDTTHSVAVAPGDVVTYMMTPADTPDNAWCQLVCEFTPTTAGDTLFMGNLATSLSDVTTKYYALLTGDGGQNLAQEKYVQGLCAVAGTLKNFSVFFDQAPGVGKSFTYTVRVNAADTAVVVTIADNATTGTDSTHTVAISPGDLISVKQVPSGNPSDSIVLGLGATLTATTTTQSNLAANYPQPLSDSDPIFYQVQGGSGTPSTDEASEIFYAPVSSGTIKNLYAKVGVAPGSGNTMTVTSRKNLAAGNLSVAIADAATTGNDTTHSDSIASGDNFAISYIPASTPSVGEPNNTAVVWQSAAVVVGIAASKRTINAG